MTLVEFLTARLNEDEANARECYGNVYFNEPRLLAEVDAKRQIVNRLEKWSSTGTPMSEIALTMWTALRDAARFLALPYADHPDYNEEWRP